MLLCTSLIRPADPVWATDSEVLAFENADVGAVAKQIGRLTGTTFLFDPEQVKKSALALVPLTYARADALACTLSMVAPSWVRIVSYHATNSLIISGPPVAVEELVDIIK